MPLDRETLRQIQHLLRPLTVRLSSLMARAVVKLVTDDGKLQAVQVGDYHGGPALAEHHQPFGISSVPLPGAEAIVVFPNGDPGHPIAIVISDRRHRPTGAEPGTVTLYNQGTGRVIVLPDGGVEIRSQGGTATRLPTLADYDALRAAFNAHTHTVATTGSATAQTGTAAAVATPVGAPSGTAVLKAE